MNRAQSVEVSKNSNFEKSSGNRKVLTRGKSLHVKNLMQQERRLRSRTTSFDVIEDLLKCAICMNRLSDPRMLKCQHTFCLNCLQSLLLAKNIPSRSNNANTNENKLIETNTIICPTCQNSVSLDAHSLEKLPKNLYIENLLKVIDDKPIAESAKNVNPENRCTGCHVFLKDRENICKHCFQAFCNVCWNEHLSELEKNLPSLLTQLDDSHQRLDHKLEIYENRCSQLDEQVKETAKDKHFEIDRLEAETLNTIDDVRTAGRHSLQCIKEEIEELRNRIKNSDLGNGRNKVTSYMNLHQETSKLIDAVYNFGEEHIIFDPNTFKLEHDDEGVYNEITENDDLISTKIAADPLADVESLTVHYKIRTYKPKLVWAQCPRPAGIAVAPWDTTKLYITTTDNHNILIFHRQKEKLIGRLSHEEMICPQSITFCQRRKELYVSDKWKHCILVFSHTDEYLRQFGSKGSGNGKMRNPSSLAISPSGELLVCDAGNNRISVLNPETGEQLATIGNINGKPILNCPSGIAVYGNNIIVADTGNHRVRTFTIKGEMIQEFGSLGRNPGQFRSAEVIAVDPLGFIFVGDGGNARVQIFKSDGTLVKMFGSSQRENGFKWISGIHVTSDLDIITADNQGRSLKIF